MKTAALRVVIALFLCPAFGLAQNIVSGTITDQATASPIPGVNVVVKNTNSGAVSDFDGKFTLSAANGDVLVFSYVGYSTKEVVYQVKRHLMFRCPKTRRYLKKLSLSVTELLESRT